jgi:hypothetical protein
MQYIKTPLLGNKRAIVSIAITCVIGWICAYMAVKVFVDYALGLFIWLPVVMGIVTTILYSYDRPANRRSCIYLSFLALTFFCVGLLAFAFEGLICVIMAAPIGALFNFIGSLIGLQIVKRQRKFKSAVSILILFVLSAPALMSFEFVNKGREELHSITTSIIVKASPEVVWKNVISFPELQSPKEFVFKTGIAYPINAKISGHGIGAVRSCNFSTGSFIEPVTVWNEPSLLKFDVLDQPETMKELSFYDIHPTHLHGYFVSKQGQFLLTKRKDGSTLLQGTTWYYNKIKPTFYWDLWSDYIVHKIHQRVLDHIKRISEVN